MEDDEESLSSDDSEKSTDSESNTEESCEKQQNARNRRFSQLITVPTVLLVGSILTFGTLHGLWGGFYCLFLEKVIGASQSQMGATFAVATFGETIAMFFSGYLHRKLGYQKCLAIVYLAFAIR